MATREYVGAGITVHWDGDRCFHSERCTTGLPAVFDRRARPWVDPDAAGPDELAAVIDTCPSGALTYTRTDGRPNGRRGRTADEDPTASLTVDPSWATTTIEPEAALSAAVVTIRPMADGPLAVSGPVAIARPDGTLTVAEHWQLCRCGHSGAKPYCDGSHAAVGFSAPGAPDPAEQRIEARP